MSRIDRPKRDRPAPKRYRLDNEQVFRPKKAQGTSVGVLPCQIVKPFLLSRAPKDPALQNFVDFLCTAATMARSWPIGLTKKGTGAMMKNIDDMQKIGKDNMDATMKSFGAVSKSMQAIAVEVADFSKKSFEESSAAMERLFGAKTIDKAIEVQSDYVKATYESFVAEATKLSELYADLAKESYKPFESYLAKVSTAK
jgi:phasin family protein